MSSKWIWALVMATSVALVGCGSVAYRGDMCLGQPALPPWMVSAGVFLIVIGATTAAIFEWRKKTLLPIGWAFCWGLLLVVGYLIWLAMWIAGSYFIVDAIRTLKIDRFGCAHFTVGVAGASVFIVWLVFFYVCVSLARLLLASTRKTNEDYYAAVPN